MIKLDVFRGQMIKPWIIVCSSCGRGELGFHEYSWKFGKAARDAGWATFDGYWKCKECIDANVRDG